jgi:hypothetical protein
VVCQDLLDNIYVDFTAIEGEARRCLAQLGAATDLVT